ncbi:hypothetical protein NQ315_005229 [Exocentrus adspersus]|uniref:Carboxylic ester hydrolase n=1 Tax=Exocentrus adspersus TaxID=1586481 RepID=A0AAV8W1F2_9CUCU|nr:hypothetical protein NQ315_005229 [Exocentrus adspersus]
MKHILVGFLVSVIFLLCISNTYTRSLEDAGPAAADLVVETTSGAVRGGYGGRTPVGGNPVYWFRSIPFAEPPVGNLRFQPPVPVRRWSGVRDVFEKRPQCLQGGEGFVQGSEDCLYLKIYTTKLPREQKKLPVMVWIYGGAFFAGAADFDDHSPDLLLDQDVIVAALHYRVGIFGFLSTEDLVVPGNNGLKDQIEALRWIKKNIERFGGDPDNITIFGQSAGGASVGYLLQTPQTQGLFNRAILHSGSPLCLWSLSRVALDLARSVASNLNVDSSDTQTLVDNLRGVDAEELQSSYMSTMMGKFLSQNLRDGLVVAPVIEPEHEGAVLTGKSHQLLSDGQFHKVPIIIGYTSLEARLSEIPDIFRIFLLQYDLQPSKLVPIDMGITSLITRSSVGRQIRSHYFPNGMISQSYLETMEFISDDQFARPIQEAARLFSRHTDVYFYRFSHEGSLFGVRNRTVSGVGHTEDLGYLFDFGHEGSAEDYLTRNRVVKLWTNFAKSGNPTPVRDPLLQNIQWTPANGENVAYLEIDKDLQVSANPNSRDITFWKSLYDRNGRPPYATY